eukprot:8416564-Lingulodinium_polyedra.AAC.1
MAERQAGRGQCWNAWFGAEYSTFGAGIDEAVRDTDKRRAASEQNCSARPSAMRSVLGAKSTRLVVTSKSDRPRTS